MTTTNPRISQRLNALDNANRIRIDRSRLKQQLHAGSVQLAAVLDSPPACIANATILELLLTLPRVGRVKALKALRWAEVSAVQRVGKLTVHQCDRILSALAPRPPRPLPLVKRRRDLAAVVKRDRATGMSYGQLAKRHGISRSQAFRVCKEATQNGELRS